MSNSTATSSELQRPAITPRAARALLLFFLAPALAELLTSSSPPKEYFSPFVLIALHLCYGTLAVLLDEFSSRYRLGPWGKLVLALTAGVFVEGIVCKSFFSPQWPDFSLPEGFGRLFGVNWPWTVNLMAFHASQSLLLPWLVADLVIPVRRSTAGLTQCRQAWLGAALLFTGVLGWTAMPMNKSGAVYHPGALAAIVCWSNLVFIPWLSLHVHEPRAAQRKPPHPYVVGWSTGICWFAFFFVQYESQQLHAGALLTILVSLAVISTALITAWIWRGQLDQPRQFAVVAGSIWFWSVFSMISQMDNPRRPDDTSGMMLLGGIAIILLFVLRQRLLRNRACGSDKELIVH